MLMDRVWEVINPSLRKGTCLYFSLEIFHQRSLPLNSVGQSEWTEYLFKSGILLLLSFLLQLGTSAEIRGF